MKGKTAYSLSNLAKVTEYGCYLLLLLLLPTQLGKHFWPSYAVVLGFRVDYLSPTLYLTDILILILFLLWFVRIKPRITQAVLPYLLLTIFLCLTLVQAVVPLSGFYTLIKVLEFTFFAWYTARYLSTALLSRLAPVCFLIGLYTQSMLSILQTIGKGSLNGWLYWFGERSISSLSPGAATVVLNGEVFVRPYGTFSHPNVLAGFLVLSLIFLWYSRKIFLTPLPRLLLLGGIGLGTLGLIATLSRLPITVWLVFLLIVAIRAIFKSISREGGKLRLIPLVGLALVILGSLLVALPLVLNLIIRFAGTSLGEESFLVRVDLAQIAWQLITTHSVLGVGLGNFLFLAAPLKAPETPLFFAVQPVHNIFLLVWAEIGTLGLLVFLWFLGRSFLRGTSAARILLFVIVLLGTFDHYFLTLQQGQLLFAFILGYCWVESSSRERGTTLSNYVI